MYGTRCALLHLLIENCASCGPKFLIVTSFYGFVRSCSVGHSLERYSTSPPASRRWADVGHSRPSDVVLHRADVGKWLARRRIEQKPDVGPTSGQHWPQRFGRRRKTIGHNVGTNVGPTSGQCRADVGQIFVHFFCCYFGMLMLVKIYHRLLLEACRPQ